MRACSRSSSCRTKCEERSELELPQPVTQLQVFSFISESDGGDLGLVKRLYQRAEVGHMVKSRFGEACSLPGLILLLEMFVQYFL